jgi:ribonuclease P protein subunit POP4
MISPRNVIRHELIGLDVLVVRASNPTHTGVSGKIMDESRNMLIIRTGSGLKRIPKKTGTFRVSLPDGIQVDIQGSVLVMAPEKRVSLQKKK